MHKSDGPRTTGQSDGPYNFCDVVAGEIFVHSIASSLSRTKKTAKTPTSIQAREQKGKKGVEVDVL